MQKKRQCQTRPCLAAEKDWDPVAPLRRNNVFRIIRSGKIYLTVCNVQGYRVNCSLLYNLLYNRLPQSLSRETNSTAELPALAGSSAVDACVYQNRIVNATRTVNGSTGWNTSPLTAGPVGVSRYW